MPRSFIALILLPLAWLLPLAATAQGPDRALQLGDSAYVDFGDPGNAFDLVPGRGFTLMLWLRLAERPATHARVFSKRHFARPAEGYELFFQETSTLLTGLVDAGERAEGLVWQVATFLGEEAVGVGRWRHVALVQDGDTFRLYVDGLLAGERRSAVYGVPLDTEAPLLLGASGFAGFEGASTFLPGIVDDVSVWHRALSARELRQRMYQAPRGEEEGLVAYWPFAGGEGEVVRDLGPHGYHGRIVGPARWVPSTRPTGPPWYERGWFYALSVALGLALLYSLMRLYALRIERQKRQLEGIVAERTRALERAHEDTARVLATVEAQAARLIELDEAKNRFFANLSHEFRTPLTLILGPLQGLLDGRYGKLDPGARGQYELMLRNGRRLLRLINQILDLAKLETGRMDHDPRPRDLVAFAREVTLAFAPLAERRQVRLRFRSELPELVASFDAEQLEKVLLNLLSNALKFTEADGEVEVTVRTRAETAEVVVRDTGVGIAPEELPRVFERFHQADTSATRRYEGTGIELALAKELVELHGGTLRVESTRGAGSTFTVVLPLGEPAHIAAAGDGAPVRPELHETEFSIAPPLDAAAPEEGESAAVEEDRTTVLVVDDNPDVRAYVRSVLEPAYRVIEAADGAAGLARAREALPDLIVADVMMPELDGLALGRALKSDPMTDAIPLLLLTARAAPEDQVAGLEAGADGYLVKPFEPTVLEARIANLLAQRRLLRERFGVTPSEHLGAER